MATSRYIERDQHLVRIDVQDQDRDENHRTRSAQESSNVYTTERRRTSLQRDCDRVQTDPVTYKTVTKGSISQNLTVGVTPLSKC